MSIKIDAQGVESDLLTALQDRLGLTLRRIRESDTVKIEIMVCSTEEMIDLEKKHFSSDTPTDVLSFPVGANPEHLLGSIVICREIATKQAEAAGISYSEEVVQLAEHGMLHLLNYHHK